MFANVVFADGGTALALGPFGPEYIAGLVALIVLPLVALWLTTRHIPNQQVGVVEKLWSRHGSVPEGRIIALPTRDPELMGNHTNGLLANTLGWAYFALICVLSVAAPILFVVTNGGGG